MTKMCSMQKKVMKDGQEVLVCDDSRSQLMEILQDIQREKGFISDDDMQNVADRLGIHPVEVYSVVTFYSFFNTHPKGQNIIRVSMCISCVMAGAEEVLKAFEKALGIKAGETTADKKFSLEKTSCIGMCDQSPAVLINDRLIGHVRPESVQSLLNDLK
ncbi:MAG: NADH-quinone oxidoreductase subunit NuoE [Candidatus Omnitrophota bacterium]